MNKKINLAILSIVAVSILLIGAVQASTVMNMTWNAGGVVDVDFDSEDAYMAFHSQGYAMTGSLYAEDYDDNPYGYGVDTFKTNVDSYVENGYITYGVQRLASKESMYGPADQSTYSEIGASEWASLSFQTRTNYADLDSSNYGYQANDQFLASGEYVAYHTVTNGDNNAYFKAMGLGTLDIDHMTDDTSNTAIKFGSGCGCYTNADVTQSGAGLFEVGGEFQNGLTTSDVTVTGQVTYVEQYTFSDGFSWADYSFSGN